MDQNLTPEEATELNGLANQFDQPTHDYEEGEAVAQKLEREDTIVAAAADGVDFREQARKWGFTDEDYNALTAHLNEAPETGPAAVPPSEAPDGAVPDGETKPKDDGSILGGIAAGALRAPAAALGGTVDFAADIGTIGGNAIAGGVARLDEKFFDNQLIPRLAVAKELSPAFKTLETLGDVLFSAGDTDEDGATEFGSVFSGGRSFAELGNDTANKITTEVGSVVLAFGGLRSAATRGGLTKALREGGASVRKDALISGVSAQVLDPNSERLSNALINLGVKDPTGLLTALATEEDESRLKGRISLFVEDAAIGAAVDSVFKVGTYAFHAFRGNTKRLTELEQAAARDLPNSPDSVSPSPSADTPVPQAASEAGPPLPVQAADTPEVLLDDAAFRVEMDGFAKRAGADVGNLEVADGRFVVPDGEAAKLNKAARKEGAPRDLFVDNVNRSKVVSGGGSVKQAVLDSLKQGDAAIPSNTASFRLNSSEGVIAAMREFHSALPPTTATATPPVPRPDGTTLDNASRAAESLGLDINVGLDFVRSLGDTTEGLDELVRTAQIFTEQAYKDLDDILPADIADLSGEALQDVFQRVHNAYLLGEAYVKVGTGLGRGLRARRGLTSDDYIQSTSNPQQALDFDRKLAVGDTDIPGLPYTRESLAKWLQDFQNTSGNKQARAGFLKDGATLPNAGNFLGGSLANYFTTSILSGLYTFTTNIVAPALISPTRTTAKLFGGVSRSALLAARGNLPEAQQALQRGVFAAQAHAIAAIQAGQMVGEISRRLLAGDTVQTLDNSLASRGAAGTIEATKRGNSVLRSGNFLDVLSETRVDVKNIDESLSLAQKTGYILGNKINFLPRQFRRINSGLDEFVNRVAYTGESAYHLFADAQAQGLRGAEAKDYVQRKLPGILNADNAASSPSVLREAQRTTLTGRPGTPGGTSEKMIQAVNNARKDSPLVRTILPIFNVPMNGVGELLRSVPGSNIFLKELRDDLAGARGAALQEEAWGRWQVATGIMAMGYVYANNGLMTGQGPSDPRARRRWLESGYKPYSIRLSKNGDWVDYTRFDQIGGLLGLISTFQDQTIASNNADKNRNIFLTGAGSLASYFRDKSALQGLTKLLSADDSGPNSRNIERTLRSVAASIAVPNIIPTLTVNTTDPIQRRRDNTADDLLARIPFASEHLAPILNTFGEPIHKRRETLHENLIPYLHDSPRGEGEDPVMDEMENIYLATGSATGVIMDSDLTGGRFRSSDVILDDMGEERAWDIVSEYAYLRGQIKIDGKTLKETLADTFSSEDYRDDTKFAYQGGTSSRTLDGRRSRNAVVIRTFTKFNKAAKAELARKSEKAARALTIIKLHRGMGTALREIRSTDVIEDPSILDGIVIDGFDVKQFFNDAVAGARQPVTEGQ